MGFRELIKQVQLNSGFSDEESRDALEMMVESLSVHLGENERKDFASQLPHELQDLALSVLPTEETAHQNMIEQFMEAEEIDEPRAKKQIFAAWEALKEAISSGQIRQIKTQLPGDTALLLH
ncbi:MAG TPA: DUF2267 domain-containing protein [Candidatus Saccharimonadales bacterium]